jgi:hypothetical protein
MRRWKEVVGYRMVKEAIITHGKYPTKKEKYKLEKLILKRLKKEPFSIYQLSTTLQNCSSPLIMTSLLRLIARNKIGVREEKELQGNRKTLRFFILP